MENLLELGPNGEWRDNLDINPDELTPAEIRQLSGFNSRHDKCMRILNSMALRHSMQTAVETHEVIRLRPARFTRPRVTNIVELRLRKLKRIDYVLDVLDVLLHHLIRKEYNEEEQRFPGVSRAFLNDTRTILELGRGETFLQRELLLASTATAEKM